MEGNPVLRLLWAVDRIEIEHMAYPIP
jgi:hypothetical protein